jgi:4-aminobutyrate aminotransferase-like enzyme/Ser/Thr protein kinase RdoA (MazF antagonist)
MNSVASGRPKFTPGQVGALAEKLYGLSGSARELPSERDQNFHFLEKSGRQFVLKVSSAGESRDVLEFQNAALEHLAKGAPDYGWPQILTTLNGEKIAWISSPGAGHFVRLLSYLPGRFLALVKPHRSGLLRSLGVFLGTMDKALSSFTHPAMNRDLKWNMNLAPETIRRLLSYIDDRDRRTLVEHFLERYLSKIVPAIPKLRTSVVHNDANDYNVLVGHASAEPAGRFSKVSGIIDFGDMVHSYMAVEAATGAAYAMMGKGDPLAAALPVISGYHEVWPLTEIEIESLYDFIAMRLCLSVVISAEQKTQEPDNTYLIISEKPAWELLRKWRDVHPRFAHCSFREACGLSPCLRTDAVVSWLKSHPEKIGPVVRADWQKTPPVVFDLSVGSPELSYLSEPCDMEGFSRLLFGRIEATGSAIGIGRYDEARRFYTGDIFKAGGDDSPEWRTIHIGIDLYIEPGTSVLCPLDGVVHSLQDNRAPLDYGPTVILEHAVSDKIKFWSLYGHLSRDSLAGLSPGRAVIRGQEIGRIGHLRENGGWPPHLHFQIITDMLDKNGDYPGVAAPSQRGVWLHLCPDPNLILQIPERYFHSSKKVREAAEIVRLRREYLGPTLSISYKRPLKIVRAFRQFLYDDHGQAYLDAVNNVPHVGHCHPRVVRAVHEQMALLNTNTRYLHDNIIEYAMRLAETLPEPLRVFFFVSSGSEANDLALRLAWTHTGRRDLIVVDGAYHGNSSSLIEISPYKFDGPGGRGAPPHVHKVPTPDIYRGRYRASDRAAGLKYAKDVGAAIQKIRKQGREVAAFICESLMGCAGQIVYPDGYLQAAFAHVRRAGGVCIADEVQVGFGRVGTHFWGFETQGEVPDILTLGKPMGNGHPLGAVVTTPEIAASFDTGMEYFSTFGGNPVSCAVGLAVLDIIRDEKLQENAREVGAHLKAGLIGLKSRHPLIGDVRGLGLFLGVELVLDQEILTPATAEAALVAERMREKGVLVSTDGPFRNVLKIKPPLCFTRENADFLVETLDRILSEDALIPPF